MTNTITTNADELAYAPAHELAARIRRRDLSPVEVVDACIARIEARNPSLNALVYLGFDDARREARAAEDAVMRGAELGPLHGVPAAIKDLFDTGHFALEEHLPEIAPLIATFLDRTWRPPAVNPPRR